MYTLGFDIGSSSVKVSLYDIDSSLSAYSSFAPKTEMEINSPQVGWAEQDPNIWWESLKTALKKVMVSSRVCPDEIKAIGISYQMHGLVIVDRDLRVLRPAIIWCDSRAVTIGNQAFKAIGEEVCLTNLLNSPGNFTASKLKWVKDFEPETYKKIYKILLPGDYISARLTGEVNTTVSGLSEAILWDFKQGTIASFLLDHYGLNPQLLPEFHESFAEHGTLLSSVASELGLKTGIPVTYKAGDQPNNAFSLNVFNPGEIAATAGTSGVVYGISDTIKYDKKSRVNTFAHVNHTLQNTRLGILLCINGTGALYSWIRKNISPELSYVQMNHLAATVEIGSQDLVFIPFGNGAERILENNTVFSRLLNLNFNRHTRAHLIRAAQESIVFALYYGLEILKEMNISPKVIRAGNANMFLSKIFTETLATLSRSVIELYDTDGALGAARGAAVGCKIYNNLNDAFKGLKIIRTEEPDVFHSEKYDTAYQNWKNILEDIIK